MQVVYLKVGSKKQEIEIGKEKKLIKDAHWGSIPLRTFSGLSEELCKISLRIVFSIGQGGRGGWGIYLLNLTSYQLSVTPGNALLTFV